MRMARKDTISFKVCSNGDDCSDDDNIYYKYIPAPRIIQMDPLNGPLDGRTSVQVRLSLRHATPIKEVVCNFGNISCIRKDA